MTATSPLTKSARRSSSLAQTQQKPGQAGRSICAGLLALWDAFNPLRLRGLTAGEGSMRRTGFFHKVIDHGWAVEVYSQSRDRDDGARFIARGLTRSR